MSKLSRDSKDPMSTAANSFRIGGGNDPAPAGAEKLDQKKSERIPASSNRTTGPTANAVTQPGRDGGGNEPVEQVTESHNQKKSEHVKASQRF